jgi:hypothetical protein
MEFVCLFFVFVAYEALFSSAQGISNTRGRRQPVFEPECLLASDVLCTIRGEMETAANYKTTDCDSEQNVSNRNRAP